VKRISPVDAAKQLRNELNLLSVPTNMEYVCKVKRWRIIWEQELPKDCFALAMHYKGHYRIHLSKSFCKNRNAFSQAHEIAHIYLGHFENYDLTFINSPNISPNTIRFLDKQANAFAGELLMPYEYVLRNLQYGVDGLSRIFNVSNDAVIQRLTKLKLTYVLNDDKEDVTLPQIVVGKG
jgi:Zn-dependent peptidase ImmA (M78 family)